MVHFTDPSKEDVKKWFHFLDRTRELAVVNMHHAPTILQQTFGIERDASRHVFEVWADTFSDNEPLDNRVEQALLFWGN